VYVIFDDATPEFKFTSTSPTWSATLNGWYVSGDRYTGHLMTWDGASSYTEKRKINDASQHGDQISLRVDGVIIPGDIDVADETRFKILTPNVSPIGESYTSAGGTTDPQLLDKGVHYFGYDYNTAQSGGLFSAWKLQANISSSWVTMAEFQDTAGYIVSVISDGTNYRIIKDTTTARVLKWVRVGA
jgi:hypothetical protein